MEEKDDLFRTFDTEQIWEKYCGFLDLSIEEFMLIQEQLLLEQIELVANSSLGREIMGNKKPTSAAEFRSLVPFTTYDNYARYFNEQREDVLAVQPYYWARTSGRSGSPKWAPYTQEANRTLIDGSIAALILSSARWKGDVKVKNGIKILFNLPPRPYIGGHLVYNLAKRFDWHAIPPIEESEKLEFQEKTRLAFQIALKTNIDYIGSLSTVLIKVGEGFTEGSRRMKFSWFMMNPSVLFRLIRGRLRSKIKGRPMLPKDIWQLKGVICGGVDSVIYKNLVKYYWSDHIPAEMYLATESRFAAIQGWNKKGMTFYPYCDYLEFVPEEEWIKSREDKSYQPSTVLISDLEEGKRYELVITNFYGMPFLRYRLGDLIRIIALHDEELGVKLPQMVFDSRANDIIDIAGFARVDEKQVWQAIANTGIKYADWTIRKEHARNKPFLHLYIELKQDLKAEQVKSYVHEQLNNLDYSYHDLERMLEIDPLRVTLLSPSTFQRYYDEKRRSGVVDLAFLKPAHMSVSDAVIEDVIRLSEEYKESK